MTAAVVIYAERLTEVAARVAGLTPCDIQARTRKQPAALARQAVMFMMREQGFHLVEIGEQFGLDHSTVHHAHALIRRRHRVDPETRYMVAELRTVPVPSNPGLRAIDRSPLVDLARALVARIDHFVADVEYARGLRDQLQALIEMDEQAAV